MERHFALPIVIAAGLHGLLLGWPRTPATHLTNPTTKDPREFVFVIPATPPEDPPLVDAGSAGGGAGADVARLPEPSPTDAHAPFEMPLIPVSAVHLPDPTMTTIPAMRIGPGNGPAGTGLGGIVGAIALDRPPHARVQTPPYYPHAARQQNLEGEVVVQFVVDEGGRVLGPAVVRTTSDVFNEAAVSAVAKWRFEPGTVRGIAVRFRMEVPVIFRLNGE